MSKLVWRMTPVNGYDIPGLESWLERQAAKGLVFSMTVGPLTLFDRQESKALRFHLEPAPGKPGREDPELTALYEQAGWKYLGLFRGSFAVFASEDLDAQAHTDPEIWDYALKRFFRQKLLGGLGLAVFNVLLFSLYWNHSSLSWYSLRWFPVETLSKHPLIALVLTVIGLALVDLSWLLGLLSLRRYRRAVIDGKTPPRSSHGGGLLAVGMLVLAVVLAETFLLIFGLEFQPDPLEDSGFITLETIEGPGFLSSHDRFYSMDYISHTRSLLKPECWYFREYGAFGWTEDDSRDYNVPHLELSIYRYPLPFLAEQMVREQGRIRWNGAEYETLSPDYGLDTVMVSHYRNGREEVPYTRMVLRMGNTVLLAEYCGEQDLTRFLSQFAQMLENL